MSEPKWRPCPYCGSEFFSEIDMTHFLKEGKAHSTNVRCDTCGAEAPSTIWNTRAADHGS